MITREEMEAISKPFPLKDHKIREGATKKGVTWLVYIDKVAVINRLNEIFGGDWGNHMETRQLDKGVVVVDCHITIRGVTRGLNGASDSSFNDQDIAKSAGSDALKRAFTCWGGALYLSDTPHIWTQTNSEADKNEAKRKFADWYRSQFGDTSDSPVDTQSLSNAPTQSRNRQTTKQTQASSKTAQTGAQGETNGNLFDGMATLSRVVNAKHNDNMKHILKTSAGDITIYSRQMFIDAGWCDENGWLTAGSFEDFNPPIHINVSERTNKDGKTFLQLDSVETNPLMEAVS